MDYVLSIPLQHVIKKLMILLAAAFSVGRVPSLSLLFIMCRGSKGVKCIYGIISELRQICTSGYNSYVIVLCSIVDVQYIPLIIAKSLYHDDNA